MQLTVNTTGLQQAVQRLRALPEKISGAGRYAINRTAELVRRSERAEMVDVFDKPTPFTLGAIYVREAKSDRDSAEVGIATSSGGQHPPINWLRWQVKGGLRTETAFERLLVINRAMNSGDRAVPGKGARLDNFGNISRGQLVQILSQLRIENSSGSKRSLTQFSFTDTKKERRQKKNKIRLAYGRAGGQFFALPNGSRRLLPGIYIREGGDFGAKLGYIRHGNVRPVLIFVSKAQYEAERFDFYYVAQLAINRNLGPELGKAVARALAAGGG